MELKVMKIKVLGRGTSGVVHLVKIVAPIYNQIYAVKSFVGCPNIIQCYCGFTSAEQGRGEVYNLFLEYAPGGSLLDMMNKYGGKIPERDVNCYTQMILEGLLDVYEKGFIHSDRKLGNILAFPPQHGTHLPTLKIVDFRLAKQQGVKDTRFGFQGTMYYMSPESIVEKVSGRSPWDTHDRDDLRDKLLMGESPNILEDMSKLGNSFLRECFTINPNKRWNASKLLCHPYLLLSEHMLPKDNQQSLPYFQQQKVLESQNIPPLLGFNIPNKI
uniref:Protein kinase domain-containing protein n=2 Tax=Gossypium raimondii TaxID=29730 RepID=A0A0D2PWU2_GOSRA|nr:hypothetical protein B456_001G094900 [Gossypium raimondii]